VGAVRTELSSVSCTSPSACTAMGSTITKTDHLGETAGKTAAEAEP
jgi:hypothetical protein